MTDAERRKKVIRGLECCLSPNDHENCPYDGIGKTYSHCLKQLVTDAFALLKEQEPRLMTLKEVEKTEEWMWVEYVSGYCGWQCQDKEDNYLNMVAWNDSTFDRKDYYGKIWRCWTSRPTPEQMRDVKWEDTDNG